ncbi:hypothetical protein HZH68_001707 [Vespula germanica]|uniref:Uncharacterized protein n=1 Tax=Vespula germanica TaxID=30212 RepID=A0A834NW55_VESGE|nr:hypothetical protein HZH68_001707 [Vespula germanica]
MQRMKKRDVLRKRKTNTRKKKEKEGDDEEDEERNEEEEEEEEENGPYSRCVASGNYEFSWFLGDQPTTEVVKPCLFLPRPKRRCRRKSRRKKEERKKLGTDHDNDRYDENR